MSLYNNHQNLVQYSFQKVVTKQTKILTVLFAALAGGAYWCTVRSSGQGCGPSMGLMWGLYWILLVSFISPDKKFPSQASFILLLFIIGFGIGGTQGYGQFNQWIRG